MQNHFDEIQHRALHCTNNFVSLPLNHVSVNELSQFLKTIVQNNSDIKAQGLSGHYAVMQ